MVGKCSEEIWGSGSLGSFKELVYGRFRVAAGSGRHGSSIMGPQLLNKNLKLGFSFEGSS